MSATITSTSISAAAFIAYTLASSTVTTPFATAIIST